MRKLAATLAAGGILACGGGGWVQQYPDVADRARSQPEAFVGPAYEQWAEVDGLIGSYALSVAKGPGRGSADLAISARRPGDVSIAVLEPTGAIMAYLWASASEIAISFREDRVVYRGPATAGAFQRALGFDLAAADVVAVMLGYGIADGDQSEATPQWDDDARRIRVDTRSGTRAWFHPLERRFDRVVRDDATGRVDVRMDSWWPDPPVPDALTIQVEPDGYRLHLRLSGSPQPNPAFRDGDFDAIVPPGFEVRPLDELAAEGGLFRRAAPAESEN